MAHLRETGDVFSEFSRRLEYLLEFLGQNRLSLELFATWVSSAHLMSWGQACSFLNNPGSIMLSVSFLKIFLKMYLSIYMAALGLCCCTRAFSSCGERGYSSLRCAGFSWRWLEKALIVPPGKSHAFCFLSWREEGNINTLVHLCKFFNV